jgi:hypothetical protein
MKARLLHLASLQVFRPTSPNGESQTFLTVCRWVPPTPSRQRPSPDCHTENHLSHSIRAQPSRKREQYRLVCLTEKYNR